MTANRKYPRLDKNCHLAYTIVDPEQLSGTPMHSYVVNISGGGIGFTATEALAKDTMVALQIRVDDYQLPVLALAKVKWCKEEGEHYDIGAEYWWVGWSDQHAQNTMADFIAEHTTTEKIAVL